MSASGGSVVLLRHGQSETNAAGVFTGLLDVGLTELGVREAGIAGGLLLREQYRPDRILSSPLRRALDTANIVAGTIHAHCVVETDWRLNERNYGALTGRSKSEALRELGPDEYMRSRRSLHGTPPPMADEMYDAIVGSSALRHLPPEAVQRTESLADVVARVQPLWDLELRPAITDGATVLIVAHGNSLRALCAIIDALSATDIESLNIPTGQPLMYCVNGAGQIQNPHGTYLDVAAARTAAANVAAEGGT